MKINPIFHYSSPMHGIFQPMYRIKETIANTIEQNTPSIFSNQEHVLTNRTILFFFKGRMNCPYMEP